MKQLAASPQTYGTSSLDAAPGGPSSVLGLFLDSSAISPPVAGQRENVTIVTTSFRHSGWRRHLGSHRIWARALGPVLPVLGIPSPRALTLLPKIGLRSSR